MPRAGVSLFGRLDWRTRATNNFPKPFLLLLLGLLHGHTRALPAELVLVGVVVPARDLDPALLLELLDAVLDLSDGDAERFRDGALAWKALLGLGVVVGQEACDHAVRARHQPRGGVDPVEKQPLGEEVAVGGRHASTRFAFDGSARYDRYIMVVGPSRG